MSMELTGDYLHLVVLAIGMIAAGALAGVLAGLLGVGGGIVVVPVLFAVLTFVGVALDMRMHIAVATSLATIIPTSISSIRSHHKKEAVDWEVVRRWGGAVVLGALLGGWLANHLDGSSLSLIFAVMAVVVAIFFAVGKEGFRVRETVPVNLPGRGLPVMIGAVSALMGIGGGTLSVPVLSACSVPTHRAVATAAVFGCLIAVPGTAAFVVFGWGKAGLPPMSFGYVNVLGFVLIAPLQTIFAPLGARIAHAVSARVLRRLFALFLLATAVKMFVSAFG